MTTRDLIGAIRQARQAYAEMVQSLRTGEQLPRDLIREILEAAEFTADDLIDDVFASDDRAFRPGQPCPKCGEPIRVLNSRQSPDSADLQLQYLGCRECGFKPDRSCRRVPRRHLRIRSRRIPGSLSGGSDDYA